LLAKSKDVKTASNIAEYSEEGCSSQKAVSAIVVVVVIIIIIIIQAGSEACVYAL
jgi:hypothetical protein